MRWVSPRTPTPSVGRSSCWPNREGASARTETEGQDEPKRGARESAAPHTRRAFSAHSARRLTSSHSTFSMNVST